MTNKKKRKPILLLWIDHRYRKCQGRALQYYSTAEAPTAIFATECSDSFPRDLHKPRNAHRSKIINYTPPCCCLCCSRPCYPQPPTNSGLEPTKSTRHNLLSRRSCRGHATLLARKTVSGLCCGALLSFCHLWRALFRSVRMPTCQTCRTC